MGGSGEGRVREEGKKRKKGRGVGWKEREEKAEKRKEEGGEVEGGGEKGVRGVGVKLGKERLAPDTRFDPVGENGCR